MKQSSLFNSLSTDELRTMLEKSGVKLNTTIQTKQNNGTPYYRIQAVVQDSNNTSCYGLSFNGSDEKYVLVKIATHLHNKRLL